MLQSAPLELLADAAGSVTFGWAGEGVFYARFSRSLSARLGESFAVNLDAALTAVSAASYFVDARDLESYDLSARSATLRVLERQKSKLQRVEILWWDGDDPGESLLATLGDVLHVTHDFAQFEAKLLARAPEARFKLVARPDSPHRSRWPLRR